jgi:release factor glutamine methyltransferase
MQLYDRLWRKIAPLYDGDEAKAITRLVLEELFSFTLTDIVCGRVDELQDDDKERLAVVLTRLEKGEPVQYVLGKAYFGGRAFHVAEGVLIPRPETEVLCSEIAKEANAMKGKKAVLDIGTGSGCIAVTLALDIENAKVSAWDISHDALAIASGNAKELCAEVDFVEQDALNAPSENVDMWDVIVSNPPYICEQEKKDMAVNVLNYEPSLALFVPDDDPLRFYTAIATYAAHALKHGGRLYFEINPIYANDMLKMMAGKGFMNVRIISDQYGKQRFVCGMKQ